MKVICIENLMWRTESGYTEFKREKIYDYDKPTIRKCLIKDLPAYLFNKHFKKIENINE